MLSGANHVASHCRAGEIYPWLSKSPIFPTMKVLTGCGSFYRSLKSWLKNSPCSNFSLRNQRRPEVPRLIARMTAGDAAELWDFMEGAVENLDTRDRLVAEFRRASRHLLHASHTVSFCVKRIVFGQIRGTSFFSTDDPIVAFFEESLAIAGRGFPSESGSDHVAEIAVRNRLALWGARLLVPVHDNGRLLGLIAFGVRDDGQPYDEGDRTRAVFFARLLRHSLAKTAQFRPVLAWSLSRRLWEANICQKPWC